MNMNEEEYRQAMGALDAWGKRIDYYTEQVSLLNASLEEVTRAKWTLEGFIGAKEGEDAMIPIGGSVTIPVVISSKRTALVGVGDKIHIEKSFEDALADLNSHGESISKALNSMMEALRDAEARATELSMSIQNGIGSEAQS